MNYRHAYHAGNFADVLKHIVLARVIDYMKRKPAPFRVLDAHAGTGIYDLESEAAVRTSEWTAGIGRLWGHLDEMPPAARQLLTPYLDTITTLNDGGPLKRYPGSPALAAALIRPTDRLALNELHPEDARLLRSNLRHRTNVHVSEQDAYQFLKANLPPPEKRGVVLVDPAYEAVDERRRLVAGVAGALDRFATGTYLLWYPVKDQKPTERLERDVRELVARYGLKPGIDIRLMLRPPRNTVSLSGAGIMVLNPPHVLATEMRTILDAIAPILTGTTREAGTVTILAASQG